MAAMRARPCGPRCIEEGSTGRPRGKGPGEGEAPPSLRRAWEGPGPVAGLWSPLRAEERGAIEAEVGRSSDRAWCAAARASSGRGKVEKGLEIPQADRGDCVRAGFAASVSARLPGRERVRQHRGHRRAARTKESPGPDVLTGATGSCPIRHRLLDEGREREAGRVVEQRQNDGRPTGDPTSESNTVSNTFCMLAIPVNDTVRSSGMRLGI